MRRCAALIILLGLRTDHNTRRDFLLSETIVRTLLLLAEPDSRDASSTSLARTKPRRTAWPSLESIATYPLLLRNNNHRLLPSKSNLNMTKTNLPRYTRSRNARVCPTTRISPSKRILAGLAYPQSAHHKVHRPIRLLPIETTRKDAARTENVHEEARGTRQQPRMARATGNASVLALLAPWDGASDLLHPRVHPPHLIYSS